MPIFKQPSVFISHGTIYEAFKSNKLKLNFIELRERYLKNIPSAIVLFSGHWETESVSVSTNKKMVQLDEGFPTEFTTDYETAGHPILANRIIEMLNNNGIKANESSQRGLDHGALIPLLLIYPNDKIPVVQVSLQNKLNPNYHQRIAEILSPLQNENVLFLGSGGLVHNRNSIQRFSGHEIKADDWAKEFDDFISAELADTSEKNYTDKLIAAYNHEQFKQAHPTSEQYLPLVIASAFGGQPEKIYEAFQWKNLSMSAFIFK